MAMLAATIDACVSGHEILPVDGQGLSPWTASGIPRWWSRFSPLSFACYVSALVGAPRVRLTVLTLSTWPEEAGSLVLEGTCYGNT